MAPANRSDDPASVVPPVDMVISRFGGTVVVSLHGDLDLGSSAGLDGTLRDLIDGQGNLAIAVDLRDVARIDCSGVDVLAGAADRIATRGGRLRLGGPAGSVFDALAMSGLARLIDIPFEQEQRLPATARTSAGDARQRVIDAHPAGKARYSRNRIADSA